MFIKQIEMRPFGMVVVELSNSRNSPSDQGYGLLLGTFVQAKVFIVFL